MAHLKFCGRRGWILRKQFIILFLACSVGSIRAEASSQLPLVFAGEDRVNGYRYEVPGIGGFSSTVSEGETVAVALITMDPGVSFELCRDGKKIDNGAVEIIYEPGFYELYLFPDSGSRMLLSARFSFTVKNEFTGEKTVGHKTESYRTETVENPDLSVDFDSATGMYEYTLPNATQFRITVPVGGVSDTPVSIELLDGNYIFTMKRDGEETLLPKELVFREKGRYKMMVFSNAATSGGEDSRIYQTEIQFAIGTELLNQMEILNAPSCFQIKELTGNGRILSTEGGDWIRLTADGQYHALFEAAGNTGVLFELQFMRDTTPPYLLFSKPLYAGKREGPVSYSPSEKNCGITVNYNGLPVSVADNSIFESGRYEVVITDQAGNERRYGFTLDSHYPVSAKSLIFILAAAGLTGVYLFFYYRRNMRIL